MRKNKLAIFIFAFPALILFTVFVVYPMIPQVVMSFQSYDGTTSSGFVGFNNYLQVLGSNTFWTACGNTWLIVAISVLIAIPVSLLFALLMDYEKSNFAKNVFKIGAVFPAVISVVVIAQMWVAIYDPNWGLINSFLRAIGLDSLARSWLTDKSTVVVCISIAYLWQYIGLNTLILYTGIKSIPHTYYEAAKLDGAGFWKASFKITIPLLSDVLQYVLILSTLGSMAQFAHIRVMTAGGPGYMSRSMIYEMYYNAFSRSDFGAGSAIAVLFIIQCLIVTFVINKLLKKEAIQY
jgi:multiple sugar transport system permease protein/raffinose/stachyose/melibiose transport system permease protein